MEDEYPRVSRKEIFRSMGVAVPEGRVAFTAEEAVEKRKN